MRQFQSFSTAAQSTLPKAHKHQDTSEIYAEPENFLEIEVTEPQTHFPQTDNRGMYTGYAVICRINLPSFNKRSSLVRRRYSEFEMFHKCLLQELSLSNHPKIVDGHVWKLHYALLFRMKLRKVLGLDIVKTILSSQCILCLSNNFLHETSLVRTRATYDTLLNKITCPFHGRFNPSIEVKTLV